MNRATYFIEDKAIFGSYPNQEEVNYYESIGVKHFFDLTTYGECQPYEHSGVLIKYPIEDMNVPHEPFKFSALITYVCDLVKAFKKGEKMFVSCRGGHGRAGVFVACVLAKYHNISPEDALQLTKKYHSERKEMKARWRKIGSPQTNTQRVFVIKMFSPFYFKTDCIREEFGMKSHHSIHMNGKYGIDTATNSEDLYKLLKTRINEEMTEDTVVKIMMFVQKLKCEQNKDFLYNLMNTYSRPIVFCTEDDRLWGVDKDGLGKNLLGRILVSIRDEYYSSQSFNILKGDIHFLNESNKDD